MTTRKKALVVGAGIGGLTAAAALRRVGLDVEIYEQSPELRPSGGGLSIMSNAVLALRSLGIEPDFENHAEVISELEFMTKRGRRIRRLTFADLVTELGAPCWAIHRNELQTILVEQIGDTPITLDATVSGFAHEGEGVRLDLTDGRSVRGDLLVGADGFHSAIRRRLAGPESPRDGNYVCWLATPAYEDPRIPPGYVAHYWGNGMRFGIGNVGRGRIYWWGTKNAPSDAARGWTGTREDVLAAFGGWHDVVRTAITTTREDQLFSVPAQDRPFLERWGEGAVTLLGDAAHAMFTSLGQGAAASIEDAVVLAGHLEGATDVPAALRAYEDQRRPRTRHMHTLSASMSEVEQSEGRLRMAMRNTYFRWAPRSTLDRHNRSLLSYPPAPVEVGS